MYRTGWMVVANMRFVLSGVFALSSDDYGSNVMQHADFAFVAFNNII